jgi:hypothetical protein
MPDLLIVKKSKGGIVTQFSERLILQAYHLAELVIHFTNIA